MFRALFGQSTPTEDPRPEVGAWVAINVRVAGASVQKSRKWSFGTAVAPPSWQAGTRASGILLSSQPLHKLRGDGQVLRTAHSIPELLHVDTFSVENALAAANSLALHEFDPADG